MFRKLIGLQHNFSSSNFNNRFVLEFVWMYVCVCLVLLVCNGGLTVFAPLRGNAGSGRRPDGLSLIKPVLMEAAMYWGRSVPTERWL